MTDCSKCLRTDVKCCFTCKKDADKCKVWHHCGSDCPAHESRIKTNADRIRAMNDEELAEFIKRVSSNCLIALMYGVCKNQHCCSVCRASHPSVKDWLQSEAETKGE